MNTVDALKKLYKTLAGKDYAGDPNPTDAEMIDAIAADAQSGGSGGGLPEIVFQMDLTNASSASDRDNIGFAILTSKEEAKALGKRGSSCVPSIDIINPNNVQVPGELSSGRYNGLVCRMYYYNDPPKVAGQPNEEHLSLNPYCYSQGDQAGVLPVVHLLDYDTAQHDAWANRDDAITAFNNLLMQFDD